MRKLFSFISTTLDGYYEGPNQEFDFWTADEAFLALSVNQHREVGVLLLGRVTYQGFPAFWPSAEAVEVSPDVAELINAVPKVVFSTTLTAATWHNTTLVADDVAGAFTALKREPGKDLAVFGSSRLTASLLALGPVDELRVMVNPTLIGAGPSLFAGLPPASGWSCSVRRRTARATSCSATGPLAPREACSCRATSASAAILALGQGYTHAMSKRLRVLLDEREFDELKATAAREGTTVAERVRRAIRSARRQTPDGDVERKLAAIRTAMQYSSRLPTSNR